VVFLIGTLRTGCGVERGVRCRISGERPELVCAAGSNDRLVQAIAFTRRLGKGGIQDVALSGRPDPTPTKGAMRRMRDAS
jgi:hypothetical protein